MDLKEYYKYFSGPSFDTTPDAIKELFINRNYDPNLIPDAFDLDYKYHIDTKEPLYPFPSDIPDSTTPAYQSAQMFETGGIPRIGDSDYTIDDLRMQGMSEDDILDLLRRLSAKGYEL